MRWVVYVVLALVVLVQWPLWFGKGGWLRVSELQRAVQAQREANAALTARNNALAAEVRSLREGREAIEERARHELQMTRGDEVFFQLIRPDAKPAAAKATPSAPAAPAAEDVTQTTKK